MPSSGLIGMSQLNIELSSRCDRVSKCGFCGHQDEKSGIKYGDMDFGLLLNIARQVPPGIIVSFHRDGDCLVYPRLREALKLFRENPTSLVTHGEALNKRADDIIGNATTCTASVIPNDPDRDIQLESLRGFIAKKGDRRPMLQLKFVGHIEDSYAYEQLGVPIINRTLHSKKGNWNYKVHPTVPEIRVCLDALGRPTIDWRGRMFLCNRMDIHDEGLIGDTNTQSIEDIWNGPVRSRMIEAHLAGRRDLANPLCASCDFYGVPTPSE